MLKKAYLFFFIFVFVLCFGGSANAQFQFQGFSLEIRPGEIREFAGQITFIDMESIQLHNPKGGGFELMNIINVKEKLSELDEIAKLGQPVKIRLKGEGEMVRIVGVDREY